MTTPDLILLVVSGFGAGGTGSAVWFWYDKKKSDSELKEYKTRNLSEIKEIKVELKALSKDVIIHSTLHITDTKARLIAEEVCGRMDKNVDETKLMVKDMMVQITDLASILKTHTTIQKVLNPNYPSV